MRMFVYESAGRWWVRHSLLLMVLSFCASSLLAQTGTNEPAASLPTFQSKVSEVLVDVVISNAKDEPVSGLAKKDFEVLEDGKPQTISLFEEHKRLRIKPAKLPPMPPNVYTNFPPLKATDSVNVLLLDALNTQVSDQSYVRAQLTRYLKTVQPGTPLAVFVLTSRLRMIQSVTTDSALLLAALNKQKLESGPQQSAKLLSGAEDDANSVYTAEVMNNLVGETDLALTAMAPRGFATMAQNKLDTRVQTTLQALQQLARYLGGFPGRKNLVWFSGSFPISVFPDLNAADAFQGVRQFGGEVQRTATLLTLAQVAIYPIAAEGLVSDSQFAANANRIGETRALQTSPDFGDGGKRNANYESMETLADDTGGKAFYNTNGLDNALARALNYGSHYYTLSYSPNNKKMDGKYRRIQVKVSGKYKLAYRRGYYADNARDIKTKKDAVTDLLRPLMQRGLPDFSQILYKVRVTRSSPQPAQEAVRAGDNKEFKEAFTRYAAEFAIAAGDVALEAASDGERRGEVEIMLVAYDRDGTALNWIARKQGISLTRQNYAGALAAGLQLHYEIDIPSEMLSRDDVYLRTGVYDLRSSNAGTLEIPLHPPKETGVSAK